MTPPRPWQVLFLCTHNSARSILSEALLRHHGGARFAAHSAGSAPAAGQRPHPLGLRALAEHGVDTSGLTSKSWERFSAGTGSPAGTHVDLVITVCGNAAGENCPVFPGNPERAHWGHRDPSRVEGTEEQRLQAFRDTLAVIEQRTLAFVRAAGSATDIKQLGALARSLETDGDL